MMKDGIYKLPEHAVPFLGRRQNGDWGGVPWDLGFRSAMKFDGLTPGGLQIFWDTNMKEIRGVCWESTARIDGDGPSPVYTRAQLRGMDSPGCYGAETALHWEGARKWRTADGDLVTFCDSRTFPGIVVPPQLCDTYNVRLGDFGFCVYNGRVVCGQVYDIGPRKKLGEISVAMANALGIPSDPRRGNSVVDLVTFVMPRTGWRRAVNEDERERMTRYFWRLFTKREALQGAVAR